MDIIKKWKDASSLCKVCTIISMVLLIILIIIIYMQNTLEKEIYNQTVKAVENNFSLIPDEYIKDSFMHVKRECAYLISIAITTIIGIIFGYLTKTVEFIKPFLDQIIYEENEPGMWLPSIVLFIIDVILLISALF